jgi:hypothetical protein
MVQSGGRVANPRPQTAMNRIQAQVEKTNDKKLRSAVLVVDFEDLDRLEVGSHSG